MCPELSVKDRAMLDEAIRDYETGKWFRPFIDMVQGKRKQDARSPAIVRFVRDHVLVQGMSVLELGAGAGAQMRLVVQALDDMGGHANLTAVEAVPGWAEAGRRAMPDVKWLVADMTEVNIGSREIYDLVMLNDVHTCVHVSMYGYVQEYRCSSTCLLKGMSAC